ncbi:DUF397 domain-containing protein [Nocardia sp. NPDC004278]
MVKDASYSGSKDACVEVAFLAAGQVGVPDSKKITGPALTFTPTERDAFTAGVANGEFDRSTELLLNCWGTASFRIGWCVPRLSRRGPGR